MSLVKSESRINFGIDWYDNEAEAIERAKGLDGVTKWGQAFGRDETWDKADYAVTVGGGVRTFNHLYAVVVP